jgi:hypothetical protein
MTQTLMLVTLCEDELGECQAMFDPYGELITAWSMNDAIWSQEYYRKLMNYLNVTIISQKVATPDQLTAIKKYFGFESL